MGSHGREKTRSPNYRYDKRCRCRDIVDNDDGDDGDDNGKSTIFGVNKWPGETRNTQSINVLIPKHVLCATTWCRISFIWMKFVYALTGRVVQCELYEFPVFEYSQILNSFLLPIPIYCKWPLSVPLALALLRQSRFPLIFVCNSSDVPCDVLHKIAREKSRMK